MKDQKEPTQWDKFKDVFEKHNRTLQENKAEIIKQIEIDFEKEVLIINGKEVKEPVIIALPYEQQWVRKKIFHSGKHCKSGSLPEISISIKNSDKLKY